MNKIPSLFLLLVALASCGGNQTNSNSDNDAQTAETVYVDTLAVNHPEYLPELPLDIIAPEISASDTLGNVISLSDFRGKYVVIDFWATWCGDCRREVPELKQVYSEYADVQIKGAGVQFLSYSFDKDETQWKAFLANEQFPWPQISTLEPKWYDNPAAQSYRLHWIPAFLLVSPDGHLVGKAITAAGLRQVIKDEIKR